MEAQELSRPTEGEFSLAEGDEDTERTADQVGTDGERCSRSLEFGVSLTTTPRSSSITRTAPRSRGTTLAHARERRNPKQEAELIQARTKIVQLETDILVLQRVAKRARIEEEEREEEPLNSAQQMDRVYKLDQERCQLLQEISETKKSLVLTEKELAEKTEKLDELTQASDQETGILREQLNEAQSAVASLTSRNANITTELDQLREQMELETVGIDELRKSFDESVGSLKARVQELETVESQLHHAEAEIQRLERKLQRSKHDSHFVETSMAKVMKFDELERENRLLTEENKALRSRSDNVDLLRYRVQEREEVNRLYQQQKTEVVRLEVENKELRERLSREEGGRLEESAGATLERSVPALLYRIQDLQRRELVHLSKQGEMESRVRLAERAAADSREQLNDMSRKLQLEQEASRNKSERLQKLERNLVFVTKERDGCVNVLNSYRRDTGVDGLLQEQVSEMERQITRAQDRIAELERELEEKSTTQQPTQTEASSEDVKAGPVSDTHISV